MAEQHLVAKISDITRTGKPLVVLLKGTALNAHGHVS